MFGREWNERFFELARHIATWSKDPNTKVGAVIVNHDRVPVGMGFNGFPRGVKDDEDRYSLRPTKHALVVHSEVNAILNAVVSVRGLMLFTTKYPCSNCTKSIIQAGIDRIYTIRPSEDEPWATDAKWSNLMLTEAGVRVFFHGEDYK